jgi:hypothetical protein
VYQVINNSGQVFWRKEEYLNFTGSYLQNHDFSKLAAGNYYFVVLYNGKKQSTAFIKQ